MARPKAELSSLHFEDRAYVRLSRTWYAKTHLVALRREGIVDEVMFGYYPAGGGVVAELAVRWRLLQSDGPPTPRLEVCDDAWLALSAMPDVLATLAEVDSQNITPAQFCRLLKRCCFQDRTPRKEPWDEQRHRRRTPDMNKSAVFTRQQQAAAWQKVRAEATRLNRRIEAGLVAYDPEDDEWLREPLVVKQARVVQYLGGRCVAIWVTRSELCGPAELLSVLALFRRLRYYRPYPASWLADFDALPASGSKKEP